MQEIEALEKLLKEPLETDDGHRLSEQLAERGAWQYRVSKLHREAEKALATMKGKVFDPTLSSEDKRKNQVIFATRKEQHAVDRYKDLADILAQHISLGQTLLRSMSTEVKAGVRL